MKNSRLHSFNPDLAAKFASATTEKRHAVVACAMEWLDMTWDLNTYLQVQPVLEKKVGSEARDALRARLEKSSEHHDNLYFEQEQAGEPSSVWSRNFYLARAYSSAATMCLDDLDLEEALYEAFHALEDSSEVVTQVATLLGSREQ